MATTENTTPNDQPQVAVDKPLQQPAKRVTDGYSKPAVVTPNVYIKAQAPGAARVESELTALQNQLSKDKPVEGRWQYSLLNFLKGALSASDQEVFEREWNAILGFFNKNRGGLFDVGHILRFGDNWPGSESEFSLYRRLVWTCAETSNPMTRRTNGARLHLVRAGEGLSDSAANRLVSFYN